MLGSRPYYNIRKGYATQTDGGNLHPMKSGSGSSLEPTKVEMNDGPRQNPGYRLAILLVVSLNTYKYNFYKTNKEQL